MLLKNITWVLNLHSRILPRFQLSSTGIVFMNLTSQHAECSTDEHIENSIAHWVAIILCPLLLVVGVGGNLYASFVLIAQPRVPKTPAILTIITIGVYCTEKESLKVILYLRILISKCINTVVYYNKVFRFFEEY